MELSAHAEFSLLVPLEEPFPEIDRAAAVLEFSSVGFGAVKALRVRLLAEAATRERMEEFAGVSSGLDGGFPESFSGGARSLPLPESILIALSASEALAEKAGRTFNSSGSYLRTHGKQRSFVLEHWNNTARHLK